MRMKVRSCLCEWISHTF